MQWVLYSNRELEAFTNFSDGHSTNVQKKIKMLKMNIICRFINQ